MCFLLERDDGGGVCLHAGMQLRRSSVKGDRPLCPVEGKHAVHRHGSYARHKAPTGTEKEAVERFLCVPCRRTMSVLDDDRLPYRTVCMKQLERWLDWQFSGGPEPPAMKEVERGCLQRAVACFVRNSPSLIEALGQIVKHVRADAGSLWRALRRLGDLGKTLREWQAKIKLPTASGQKRRGLSLLGAYVCLAPWSLWSVGAGG